MTSFRDWYFEFPHIGYLILFIIPMFYLFKSLFRYRKKTIESFIQPSYANQLTLQRSNISNWLTILSFCFVWLLACLSLMDPRGNLHYLSMQHKEPIKTWQQQPRDLIFLIDASSSMTATDTRSGKSRFDTAKEIVDEIISHLNGENGSLYAFTSEPTSLAPPTLDYIFLRLALRELTINEGGVAGTDITATLQTLQKTYWSQLSNKHYTLIILSDGEDTVLEGLEGDARAKARQKILDPIKNAVESHLHVFTIGIGSQEGAKIPDVSFQGKAVTTKLHADLLKDLSLIGRGDYYSATTLSTLEISQALRGKLIVDAIYEEKESSKEIYAPLKNEDTVFNLYYQIPLGIGIIILLLTMYFPDTLYNRYRKVQT